MTSVTPEEMGAIEERCEELGLSRLLLMENAGRGVTSCLISRFGVMAGMKVLVVAGTGNNGGDGFVAARHLAGAGARVGVILLGQRERIRTKEASVNWGILEKMRRSVLLSIAPSSTQLQDLQGLMEGADIIIDAIFGTGIKGKIGEPHSRAIDMMNKAAGFKLAVDIPSGLDPTTGEVHDRVVKADATVTFHRAKPGLLGAKEYVGELVVMPIGIPPEADLGL